MPDRAAAWGVLSRYKGYRGDVVKSPDSTIQAVVAAMSRGQRLPPAAMRRPLEAGLCAPPPERVWGWAVQLYAARSKDSWGIGDFADLRRLGRWARSAGASLLLVNPLGAPPPLPQQEPCPYYTSSRRFLNLLYLRVEEIEGAARCASRLAPLRDAALALNHKRHIDHDTVFELKSQALQMIFRAAPEPRGLGAWVKRQGSALQNFATFSAIAEKRGAAWRNWPASLRHPRSTGVERARRELSHRVAFHRWVQFHLDRQLDAAAREISLITDVPVGFAADGFDSWHWQDRLAPAMRVGAPPDYFFPDGQDWGMPAFDPWRMRAHDFEPFVEALRGAAAHARGLRLDHVMSLFRLFWIPDGATPATGTYVRYPADMLLAVLAAESRRARAFVIGEDLGLVEPSVRAALSRLGALGYKLLWFEEAPPERWPRLSVAAIETHDLPTVAGIWNLTEPDHRQHHLRSRLVEATRLRDSAEPLDVAVTAYARLAKAKSCIALASLEDALAVEERPNIPGSGSGWPSWRIALPRPLEDIESAEGPRRIAEVMASAGRHAAPASIRA